MPEGSTQALTLAAENDKFSLGSLALDFTQSTFWVVLLYGLFVNLNNFGIDQSFVQRYHTARDDRQAARSVWLGALLYVPISLLFFLIGSAAFSYYQAHPEMLAEVQQQVAAEKLAAGGTADVGDKILPHFIATVLPPGVRGLLVAAIFAAAMSSIDTSLNSSATVILSDLVKRYISPRIGERGSMAVLYAATLAMGAAGTGIAVAMIGVESVLDTWWKLLGMIVRTAGRPAAATGVLVGVTVIAWMTLSTSGWVPDELRSPLDANMTIVVGTLTIFLVGLIVSRVWPSELKSQGIDSR
jgi:SSS family solute:Na+ symporter